MKKKFTETTSHFSLCFYLCITTFYILQNFQIFLYLEQGTILCKNYDLVLMSKIMQNWFRINTKLMQNFVQINSFRAKTRN